MNVAITGAKGKVGQALIHQLDPSMFSVSALDLPDCDVSDLGAFTEATKDHDAIIHLAWKDLDVNNVDPINGIMYENVYRSAVANNIGLVIMASSNHARDHTELEQDGRIRYTGKVETPNNIYGVEKQKMEAMGRYFAKNNNLRVIALRIGNINEADRPRGDVPNRWMSHKDFGRMVSLILNHSFEAGHFEVVYGVSRQQTFDWVNSFGYEPEDGFDQDE
jgi:nucleoside-diphosphate-sugar epimerase